MACCPVRGQSIIAQQFIVGIMGQPAFFAPLGASDNSPAIYRWDQDFGIAPLGASENSPAIYRWEQRPTSPFLAPIGACENRSPIYRWE